MAQAKQFRSLNKGDTMRLSLVLPDTGLTDERDVTITSLARRSDASGVVVVELPNGWKRVLDYTNKNAQIARDINAPANAEFRLWAVA